MRGEKIGYILLLPYTLLILIFNLYPAIKTLITSFYFLNLKVPGKVRYVGLENYSTLFADTAFWDSLKITFEFMAFCVVFTVMLGLGFAILLNEEFRWAKLLRVLVILPWTIPPMVNGFLWRWLLDGHHGAFNGLLYQLGILHEYYSWLSDSFWSVFFTALAQAWVMIPLVTIIILSGLRTIPTELIEASQIDGANAFQRFRYIALPWISPTLAISLAIATVTSFLAFDTIYIMTGIDPRTRVLNVLDYQISFKNLDIGLGAALSIVILIIGIGIAFYYVKMLWR